MFKSTHSSHHRLLGNLSRLFIILLLGLGLFSCNEADDPDQKSQAAFEAYEKGLVCGLKGNFQEASEHFGRAAGLDPDFLPFKANLKVAEDALAKIISSETAIHIFTSFESSNAYDYETTINELNEAIRLDPDYAFTYNERGIAFFEVGNYQASINDRLKAISLDPGYFEAYFNIGLACEKIKKYAEAIEAYRQFIEAAPKGYEDYVHYAEVQIERLEKQIARSYS